jgi:hypothetical protein
MIGGGGPVYPGPFGSASGSFTLSPTTQRTRTVQGASSNSHGRVETPSPNMTRCSDDSTYILLGPVQFDFALSLFGRSQRLQNTWRGSFLERLDIHSLSI